MDARNLGAAVSVLGQDTARTVSVARKVGALERSILLDTLRGQNISRWATAVVNLADDPAFAGEFHPSDIDIAANIVRDLASEMVA